MSLLPFIQGRLDRFHDEAGKAGWLFYYTVLDDKSVEVHITGVPPHLDTNHPRLFLLENFALKNNLGVFRPANQVLAGKLNVFSAHNTPITSRKRG